MSREYAVIITWPTDRCVEGAGPLPALLLDRGPLPFLQPPSAFPWAGGRRRECFGEVLYGLLRKVRDLSLPLISVTRAQTDQIDGPDFKQPIEATTLEGKQDGSN